MMGMRSRHNLSWGVVLLAGALLPFVLTNSQGSAYVLLLLAIVNTIGLSLLVGFARQLSIGQAAFYAIGAYTSAILAVNGIPTVIAFLAAPVVAAGVAWLLGRPLLRLTGPFLAFGTLALHLIVLAVITQGGAITGGSQGLRGIPMLDVAGIVLKDQRAYAVLAVLLVAAVVFLTRNLMDSRAGRALRGLAGPESSVSAAGIDPAKVRLHVLVLAAAIGGAAGAVYTFSFGFVAPTAFPVMLNFQLIIMATLGGMGSVLGAVVGATLLTLLTQLLNVAGTLPGMPDVAPTVMSYSVYAAVLILSILLIPQGIVPFLRTRWRDRRRRDQSATPSALGNDIAGRSPIEKGQP